MPIEMLILKLVGLALKTAVACLSAVVTLRFYRSHFDRVAKIRAEYGRADLYVARQTLHDLIASVIARRT